MLADIICIVHEFKTSNLLVFSLDFAKSEIISNNFMVCVAENFSLEVNVES